MKPQGNDHFSGTPKPAIWIDVLSVTSLIAGLKLAAQMSGAQLAYFQAAPWLVRLLHQTRLSAKVKPLEYNLGELRTLDGAGLRFAIESEILKLLPQNGDSISRALSFVHHKLGFDPERVQLYLTKSAYLEILPATTLGYLARFNKSGSGARPCLLLDATVAVMMRDWPCLQGQHRHTYNNYSQSRLKRWLKILWYFLRAILNEVVWHARGITASTPAPATAQIGVELIDGNDPADTTFYPWYRSSGIAASQISIINYRPGVQISTKRADSIEREGHNWINMRALMGYKQAHGRWQPPYTQNYRHCLSTSAWLMWQATISESPLLVWEAGRLMSLIWSVASWRAFFRRHNIVAFIQTSETGTRLLAQSIAIDRAGGMSFGTHWSHFTFDNVDHARDHSVYFSWGPFYKRKFLAEGWIIGSLVFTGHISFPGLRIPSIERYREQCMQNGAKRVVCFFDNSHGTGSHYSRQMIVGLYRRLIEEVLSDLEFGLIVKPVGDLPASLNEVSEVLRRAVATGRCIVLDNRISPGDAALAADCVVGSGFSSAVIQAVTRGKPGLHADLSGCKDNEFHKWGDGLVVFTDLDSLMAALRKRLAEGESSPIGDHTPVLRQIDPFCDGAGAQRMGRYLTTYLDAINSGAGRDEALLRAKHDYQMQFGADKVESVNSANSPVSQSATG